MKREELRVDLAEIGIGFCDQYDRAHETTLDDRRWQATRGFRGRRPLSAGNDPVT
jgi:hypothetical protein